MDRIGYDGARRETREDTPPLNPEYTTHTNISRKFDTAVAIDFPRRELPIRGIRTGVDCKAKA